MKYNITEYDKKLLLQPSVDYKYRMYIVDKNKNALDLLQGVKSIGEYNIDSHSDIRRTSSFVLQLDEYYRGKSLEQKIFSWIGYNFQLQIGIYSLRDEDYVWYECGYYTITSTNTSYSATTNELSVSLSDWCAKFDGTRNGVIGGAPTIRIPVEDEEGNKTIIKKALIEFLKLSTEVKDFLVDDIGEFYGISENNQDWEQYRKDYPEWDVLPYELEFDGSATILDIVKKICELYPNYQYYFDIYGNLCVTMIPSCKNSPITFDNSYIQKILSCDSPESVTYDIASIKNVTEIYGKLYEVDRMSEICTTSSNIYSITLEEYDEYYNNDYIAFVPSSNNISNMKLRINSLSAIPIYYEKTTNYVNPNVLLKDNTYVVKLKNENGNFVAYYLGQYQPHAICVLTSDENDEYYTKEYFSTKYNCNIKNIVFRVEDSPFTIQKIGEVLDYKTGDEFENIESDSIAIENAIYYNRKSTSINDTVSITTKVMIPFLDVNIKVAYKKQQEDNELEYIIKSVNHNLDSMSTTITMYRFYPLYYA